MASNEPEIVILHDATAVATEAAKRIAMASQATVTEKESFTIALAGGSTPKSLYLLLADEPFRSQINWELTELYWGDERCVARDHPNSNYRMVKESLLQFVPIPLGNIHRIEAELPPPEAAGKYEHLLRTRFADELGEVKSTFDLVLLGLGEDAHIASLFPQSEALHDTNHLALAVSTEARGERITLTPSVINKSRQIIFLVTGNSKAEALKRTLAGIQDVTEVPAQIIAPYYGSVTWLVDEAAAALL